MRSSVIFATAIDQLNRLKTLVRCAPQPEQVPLKVQIHGIPRWVKFPKRVIHMDSHCPTASGRMGAKNYE